MSQDRSTSRVRPPRSKRRTWAFRAITVTLASYVGLLLFEVFLRVAQRWSPPPTDITALKADWENQLVWKNERLSSSDWAAIPRDVRQTGGGGLPQLSGCPRDRVVCADGHRPSAPRQVEGLPGRDAASGIDGQPLLPLASAANRIEVCCNELQKWLIFETDRFGFRNPDSVYDGDIDTVLLGDSFIHGVSLPESTTIAGRIRDRIPATVNLGKGANGPLLELATLVEYGIRLKPRQVIWFLYENDFGDLRDELQYKQIRDYLKEGIRRAWQRGKRKSTTGSSAIRVTTSRPVRDLLDRVLPRAIARGGRAGVRRRRGRCRP